MHSLERGGSALSGHVASLSRCRRTVSVYIGRRCSTPREPGRRRAGRRHGRGHLARRHGAHPHQRTDGALPPSAPVLAGSTVPATPPPAAAAAPTTPTATRPLTKMATPGTLTQHATTTSRIEDIPR